jgi:hypothetical protein
VTERREGSYVGCDLSPCSKGGYHFYGRVQISHPQVMGGGEKRGDFCTGSGTTTSAVSSDPDMDGTVLVLLPYKWWFLPKGVLPLHSMWKKFKSDIPFCEPIVALLPLPFPFPLDYRFWMLTICLYHLLYHSFPGIPNFSFQTRMWCPFSLPPPFSHTNEWETNTIYFFTSCNDFFGSHIMSATS